LKILITCKPYKEKKALEEILSLLFQFDPSSKLDDIQIKPGLFSVETQAKKEDIVKVLLKYRRSYIYKVLPIDIITNNLDEISKIFDLIEENKSLAIRCRSRFGISAGEIERKLGEIAKNKGLKINLENPDYVIIIEPVKSNFYISFLTFFQYKILTGKKSL
jgi:tRNA(Ser,Leu) C12 N-acetylase TAN1